MQDFMLRDRMQSERRFREGNILQVALRKLSRPRILFQQTSDDLKER